ILRCGSRTLDLSTPVVMGVLNVTPDSFSDGGRWLDADKAVQHSLQMIADGAGIIDVGGESTRPGAESVAVEEELRRVIPVIEALRKQTQVPISVDTSRPEVIHAAVEAGACLINDIRALRERGVLEAAAKTSAGICLMHMQGEPRTMQSSPRYDDVMSDVRGFLAERIAACERVGISRDRIMVDPGIGFGKTQAHNLALLAHLSKLTSLGVPLLVGVSRKSLIGALTGRPVNERLAGSLAFATAAVLAGASIIRAHDVAQTVDVVRIASALKQSH
ncbi:MAG TPA: dihydropteroate synthase, partial [Steroidobacteraceae bacterium]|nr:dihydropteroate synthase [Steroidobacteraceae bacterium]